MRRRWRGWRRSGSFVTRVDLKRWALYLLWITMRKKVQNRKRTTVAPGQYLGYSLQATRCLLRLLQAKDGDHICLEVFDDVGVEKKDGKRIAEQTKSNLASNPLTDRSVAFWKNLRNWTDGSISGKLDPKGTFFNLFVTNPSVGSIAQSFHDAASPEEATQALINAKSALEWNPKNTSAVAVALMPHLKIVFDVNSEKTVTSIIRNFEIIHPSGKSPLDDIRPLMLDKLISEDACDDIIKWAHGWVKVRIDGLIGESQPARISQREFHSALGNYVRKHDRDDILRSIAGRPSDAEVSKELAFRNYVRQAQIINLDETDVLSAVNDFLMASNDRTAWADDGHISKAGIDKYSEDLCRAWKNKKEKILIAYSEKSDTDKGRLIFHDCMDHSARLEGLETPDHFTRGSFHALA
jgi:hypothetical protein